MSFENPFDPFAPAPASPPFFLAGPDATDSLEAFWDPAAPQELAHDPTPASAPAPAPAPAAAPAAPALQSPFSALTLDEAAEAAAATAAAAPLSPLSLAPPAEHRMRPRASIRKPAKRAAPGSPITERAAPGGTPLADRKRLQHNLMMRANRERANVKFKELQALLTALCSPAFRGVPMRNKMQILDRALAEYPAQRARAARLRATLILSAPPTTSPALRSAVSAQPGLLGAAMTAARLALAAGAWRYAEVLAPVGARFSPAAAFVGQGNPLRTRAALNDFANRRVCPVAPHAAAAARAGAPLWVPALRGTPPVCTALFVPVVLRAGAPAPAVIALYHAHDALADGAAPLRKYDSALVAQADEIARAVRDAPRVGG